MPILWHAKTGAYSRLLCLFSRCNEAAVMTYRINMFSCSSIVLLTYIALGDHSINEVGTDQPIAFQISRAGEWSKQRALGFAWLYGEMHVALWNQVRHVRTSPYPLTNSLVFHLPFLLGDTVSSASLHRLTESWGWVQSMFRITRRKTTERPIAKADPLKLWTSEPKKRFPPILWKAVFSTGKQVFLIRDLCGEGKLSVSRKNQALAWIKTVKMITSLNLVSFFKFTSFLWNRWEAELIHRVLMMLRPNLWLHTTVNLFT